MANVIIGIHGLGNKPPKRILQKWWELSMMEGLNTYKYNPVLPKFELVYWADILYDTPLSNTEKDVNSANYLFEKYVEASNYFLDENHETRKKIVDYLSQQLNQVFLNEDLSLNYSYIADTIVHRYFKDLETYYNENIYKENDQINKAKDLIRERLLCVLDKYKNDSVMLISHSMGSIVAFDVLKFHTPQVNVDSFITLGSPLGLPIVLSKIAAEQKELHIVGNQMTTPPGVLKSWHNFADILDKVAFNFKLADDFSENQNNIMPVDFLVVNNYEIEGERNPHKSFGYLRTPEFSKVLHEFIISEPLTFYQKLVRNVKSFFKRIVYFPLRNKVPE